MGMGAGQGGATSPFSGFFQALTGQGAAPAQPQAPAVPEPETADLPGYGSRPGSQPTLFGRMSPEQLAQFKRR